MPKIENPIVSVFDLTFGVVLVAVSEEIVFRLLLFRPARPHESLAATDLVSLGGFVSESWFNFVR